MPHLPLYMHERACLCLCVSLWRHMWAGVVCVWWKSREGGAWMACVCPCQIVCAGFHIPCLYITALGVMLSGAALKFFGFQRDYRCVWGWKHWGIKLRNRPRYQIELLLPSWLPKFAYFFQCVKLLLLSVIILHHFTLNVLNFTSCLFKFYYFLIFFTVVLYFMCQGNCAQPKHHLFVYCCCFCVLILQQCKRPE